MSSVSRLTFYIILDLACVKVAVPAIDIILESVLVIINSRLAVLLCSVDPHVACKVYMVIFNRTVNDCHNDV